MSGVRLGIDWPEEMLIQRPNVYARQVAGDSMTGDGIHDGDYVLIDPDEPCGEGDIAVVRFAQGLVLGRVRFGGRVLESSNAAYKPMLLRSGRAVICGRVIATVHVLRWDGPTQCA